MPYPMDLTLLLNDIAWLLLCGRPSPSAFLCRCRFREAASNFTGRLQCLHIVAAPVHVWVGSSKPVLVQGYFVNGCEFEVDVAAGPAR